MKNDHLPSWRFVPHPSSFILSRQSAWFWGMAAALAAGAVFRLVWVRDMEYKIDEAWVYELVCDFFQEGRFVWLGMPSSQNLRIPGLSVWVFYVLGVVFGIDEPTGLARGVAVLNLLAIGGLILFASVVVPAKEREWWFWAIALVCVNPIMVLFQRKVWPPCTLPVGLVSLLVCWWRRDRRWGAFGWGVFGALLFQIHVGMLFYAIALMFYTWFCDRARVAWRWWLAGSLVGVLPALPWFYYLSTTADRPGHEAHELHRLVEFKYWTHWASEPLGVGLSYSLGPDMTELLASPRIGARETHGLALVQVFVIGVGACLFLYATIRWWRERPSLGAWLGAGRCQTDLVLHAVLWGFGLVLTATCLRFYRHYLLLAFPFPMLWLARIALPWGASQRQRAWGRRALLGICLASGLITVSTLFWIHRHGGAAVGGYGPSYASSIASGRMPFVTPLRPP
jgi:hypothetical protein